MGVDNGQQLSSAHVNFHIAPILAGDASPSCHSLFPSLFPLPECLFPSWMWSKELYREIRTRIQGYLSRFDIEIP